MNVLSKKEKFTLISIWIATFLFTMLILEIIVKQYFIRYDMNKGVDLQSCLYDLSEIEMRRQLEPIMQEMRLVMSGKAYVDENSALAEYNFSEEAYGDTTRIETYAELLEIEIDGEEIRAFFEYDIVYYNDNYEKQYSSGSMRDEMIIRKNEDGKWVIVEIIPYELLN